MSKGSNRRPKAVSDSVESDNWDLIAKGNMINFIVNTRPGREREKSLLDRKLMRLENSRGCWNRDILEMMHLKALEVLKAEVIRPEY